MTDKNLHIGRLCKKTFSLKITSLTSRPQGHLTCSRACPPHSPLHQLLLLLPDSRVDIRCSRGHSTHPSLAPERALFRPLGGQRTPGLGLPQLKPGQDGPPEQPAFSLPLQQLSLAVCRQHKTSTRHSGAAAAAARAAHGDAGGQSARNRRRTRNHRPGPVQQSCTIAVLRAGAERVYGGTERGADDGRHAVRDTLTNSVAMPHPANPLALKCS